MKVSDKYKPEKAKTIIEDDKEKIILSDDAYAIIETIEILMRTLRGLIR